MSLSFQMMSLEKANTKICFKKIPMFALLASAGMKTI